MCGIAAVLGDPLGASALLSRIRHRGPDSTGSVVAPPIGLAAARLALNGGPEGAMPLRSHSGRTLLVANAEIFNHEEAFGGDPLRSDLVRLPDALETEGVVALSRIRGPFALVVADLRERTLLLARDQVGVRPLFYRVAEETLAVASELPALFEEPPALDTEAWAYLMALQFWPPGRTPFCGLRSLEPGTWRSFAWREGRVREAGRGTIAYGGGGGDVAQALSDAAVLQGRRAPDSGIFLSGGVDSSAVAGLLTRAGAPPRVAAVGWFPSGPPALDERPHAAAVASELGIPLMEVPIDPASWWEALAASTLRLGAPEAGPGGPSQWLVAKALSAAGCRVVFSGQGGDELFGGYERHRLLLQRDLGQPVVPAPGYEGLAQAVRSPDPLRALLFRGGPLLEHLEPTWRRRVNDAASNLPVFGAGLADRALAWEREHLLPGLLAVEDRACAAFGMESRVPLLDPAVVRLATLNSVGDLSPPEEPRRGFKLALGDALPVAVRRRRDKMGFPLPLDDWFRGPLSEPLRGLASADRLGSLGLTEAGRLALLRGQLPSRTTYFLVAAAMALEAAARGEGAKARCEIDSSSHSV